MPKKHCKTCLCGQPWTPSVRDIYWIINPSGVISESAFNNDEVDRRRTMFGNVFRTEEEAKAAVKKVKALLLKLKK